MADINTLSFSFWSAAGVTFIPVLLYFMMVCLSCNDDEGKQYGPFFLMALIACDFYLSILAALMAPWSCTFKDGETPHVTLDPSTPCYNGDGEWEAMAAFSVVTIPVCCASAVFFSLHFRCDADLMKPGD